MSDLELALKYKPYIMFDKAEPFEVNGVGYSILRTPGQSPSFRRELEFDKSKVDYVIEYSIYFDYDIQHMYDLEHIWVYVNHQGDIYDAEASFHGRFFKAMIPGHSQILDKTHLQIFSQPGKHAFLPEGYMFQLIPNLYTACNEKAGEDGLLIMDLFKDQISADMRQQDRVKKYIKNQFAFVPTLDYEYRPLSDKLFYTWEELSDIIPVRINEELKRII